MEKIHLDNMFIIYSIIIIPIFIWFYEKEKQNEYLLKKVSLDNKVNRMMPRIIKFPKSNEQILKEENSKLKEKQDQLLEENEKLKKIINGENPFR